MATGERWAHSDDWELDSAVIIDVAQEFGNLTPASLRRLAVELDTSIVRRASRREKLERIAGRQALRLFEVMDGLLPTELRDIESVRAILARSYGVGIGFALLPNSEDAPESLNEVTALDDICDTPRSWLQFDVPTVRFTYTDEAQERLRAAYIPGSGCPLIGLEIASNDPRSAETLNLFVMYWAELAHQYEPRNLPPR